MFQRLYMSKKETPISLIRFHLLLVCSRRTSCTRTNTFTESDPADKRGLGIQSGGPTSTTATDQGSREAKPELVLQTGYNNLFGATRLVFSPDGKLARHRHIIAATRSSFGKLRPTASCAIFQAADKPFVCDRSDHSLLVVTVVSSPLRVVTIQ